MLGASAGQPDAGPVPQQDDLAALDTRFQGAAFEYAHVVVRVRVDGPAVTVLEQLRGFHVARQPPLLDLPRTTAARELFIAADHCHGAEATLCARAWLPATPENRRLVEAWALPAWKRAPLVAVVRISEAPKREGLSAGRVSFSVDAVLRGEVPRERLVDNAWFDDHFIPLIAGPQRYLLTAWSIHQHTPPMPWVHSLTPVGADELPQIERALEREPYAPLSEVGKTARAALDAVGHAWIAHEAPLVAEARVGAVYSEISGAGGLWSTLVPAAWLRGSSGALSTKVPTLTLDAREPPAPYLFLAGGHAVWTRLGAAKYLVAGWDVGGPPDLLVESSPAARAELVRGLAAPTPRFAARPVEDLKQLRAVPDGDASVFEPSVPIETFAVQAHLTRTRFEVVARGKLPAGGAWIRCRALGSTGSGEWLFEGRGLPDWPVGARIIGHSLDGRRPSMTRTSLAERHALFLPGLFLPGDRNVEQLSHDLTQHVDAAH